MPGDGAYKIPPDVMVSNSGPQGMSLWQQLMGHIPFMSGGQDIELPAESGQTDPRLGQLPLQQLMKAFNTTNQYQAERTAGTGPIDALRKVGGAK